MPQPYRMKQGTTNLFSLTMPINIDECEKIEFIFVQDENEKYFVYPSAKVSKRSQRNLDLIWTAEDKALFSPSEKVYMDTRITLKGTPYQPDVDIVEFLMTPTLFKEGTYE